MTTPIRRAAVIGGGVMGSGIAAHLANAGVRVLLLDIVPPDLDDKSKNDRAARNRFSAGGLEKAVKARPAAFMHASLASLVSVGNVEDDLEKVKDCDLVIEAIIEKMEPKKALFAKLDGIVKADCIVASNTSGLRIEKMVEGRSEQFRNDFRLIVPRERLFAVLQWLKQEAGFGVDVGDLYAHIIQGRHGGGQAFKAVARGSQTFDQTRVAGCGTGLQLRVDGGDIGEHHECA